MSLKETLKRSPGIFGSAEEKEDSDWENWYAGQIDKLNSGEEIEPPWTAFPNGSPIYGWNQGRSEEWKTNVWMPFWNRMNEEARGNYFDRRQPSEEWRETLTVYWVGDRSKLNKEETE